MSSVIILGRISISVCGWSLETELWLSTHPFFFFFPLIHLKLLLAKPTRFGERKRGGANTAKRKKDGSFPTSSLDETDRDRSPFYAFLHLLSIEREREIFIFARKDKNSATRGERKSSLSSVDRKSADWRRQTQTTRRVRNGPNSKTPGLPTMIDQLQWAKWTRGKQILEKTLFST